MFALGPHASFIVAAYTVTVLALGVLTLVTFGEDREQRRKLAELERKGIRRRSGTKPSTAKTTARKPTAAKTSAKRKATTPRARKPRS